MQHYNAKPLNVTLRPSRLLLALMLLFSLAVAIVLLCMSILPMWLRLAGCLVIAWCAYQAMRQHALLACPHAWQSIQVNAKGELLVTSNNGETAQAKVLDSSVVLAYLTVLNLQLPGSPHTHYLRTRYLRTRHLLLLPDHADSEALRQLRVWLRWGMPGMQNDGDNRDDGGRGVDINQ